MQARQPIVWTASASAAPTIPATTEVPAAAEPASTPATEADTPAEKTESEKQQARSVKFGLKTETVDTTAMASISSGSVTPLQFGSANNNSLLQLCEYSLHLCQHAETPCRHQDSSALQHAYATA